MMNKRRLARQTCTGSLSEIRKILMEENAPTHVRAEQGDRSLRFGARRPPACPLNQLPAGCDGAHC